MVFQTIQVDQMVIFYLWICSFWLEAQNMFFFTNQLDKNDLFEQYIFSS